MCTAPSTQKAQKMKEKDADDAKVAEALAQAKAAEQGYKEAQQ